MVPTATPATPAAYRVTALELRDPHVVATLPLGCFDITQTGVLGAPSFNDDLQNAIAHDNNGDGFLDLNWVIVFDALDQTPGAAGTLRFGSARCTAPQAGTTCGPAVDPLVSLVFANSTAGVCLATIPGTTYPPYDPDVTVPSHPCFVTDAATITLDLAGVTLTLEDARVAALYVGTPASGLQKGLVRGFVSEASAQAMLMPATWPTVGGLPLSTLLPGGFGNCAVHDDRDLGTDGTTTGWWLYFNFIAAAVPYDEYVTPVRPAPGTSVTLGPARPNPFSPSTSIAYSLDRAQHIRITIYDVAGRVVTELLDATRPAGDHDLVWSGRGRDGRDVPAGVYFVRLQSEAGTASRKIVLLR